MAGEAIAEAFVTLRPDGSRLRPETKRVVENALGTAGGVFAGLQLDRLLTGAGQAFRTMTTEAREAARVNRLTDQVLRSTGGAANVTGRHVAELAEKMSRLAGVDDDVIQSAENVLLTFTKVKNEVGEGNDVFDQAIRSALNLSAAYGTDLQSATVQLGKALNDPIKGLTALGRAGVQFDEQQRERIRGFVETGRHLEAQKIILAELETQFGGAAAAAADPAERLNVAIGNLQETVGTTFLPALDAADNGLSAISEAFTALPSPVQTTVVALGGIATVAAGGAIALSKLAAATQGMGLAALSAQVGLGGLVGLTPQILGVGAVAAATFLTLKSLAGDSNDIGKAVDAMQQAFAGAKGELNETTAAAIAAHLEVTGISEKFAKAGITVTDVFEAIQKPQQEAFAELQRMGKQAGLTGGQIQNLGGEFHAFRRGTADAARLNNLLGDLGDTSENTAEKVAELNKAFREQADAAITEHIGGLLGVLRANRSVEVSQKGLHEAINGTSDELDQATGKMRTYGDAVEQVFNSVVAADRAHLAARQSLEDLTTKSKEHLGDAIARMNGLIRLDGKEVATQDDVKGALLDVIDARQREVDAMAESGAIANDAQSRNQALVDSLLDLRNQYPTLTGDIDRYIDAARKIPNLPLEETIDKVAGKQTDLRDATLGVVDALLQQAQADDNPIHGLEAMNTQLQGLIDKYRSFPDVTRIFAEAASAAIAAEAQILGLPVDVLRGLLNPATAAAVLSGMGLNPQPRAIGGAVAAMDPYWVGEGGRRELFVPDVPGRIFRENQLTGSGLRIDHLEYHAGDGGSAKDLVFELELLSLRR